MADSCIFRPCDQGHMHQLWATSSHMPWRRGKAECRPWAALSARRARRGRAGPKERLDRVTNASCISSGSLHITCLWRRGEAERQTWAGRGRAPNLGGARLPVLSTPWAGRRPQGAAGLDGGEPARNLRRQPGRGGAAAAGGGRGARPAAGPGSRPTPSRAHQPPRPPRARSRRPGAARSRTCRTAGP